MNLKLKELEKKAWRSTFQDGIWDIFIGLVMMTLSISSFQVFIPLPPIIGYLILSGSFNLVAFLFLYFGKRLITVPRLGLVEFGERNMRNKKRVALLVLLNIVFFIVFSILNFLGVNLIPVDLPQIIFSSLFFGFLLITFPLTLLAYILDFTRLYVYAFLGGFGFFLSELFFPITGSPLDIAISFGIIGLIVVFSGVFHLIKFLRKYPIPKKEVI